MGKILFEKGLCTSRDRAALGDGYLQTATGATYKPGDAMRAHKTLGRTTFGTTTVGSFENNLALCQFDSGGVDRLLAYQGTSIQSAPPGLTGTFTSLISGLNASATKMSVAHAYDKFFIGNGYDRNLVLKSDGTTRFHGMLPPAELCLATPGVVAVAAVRPTAFATGTFPGALAFQNPAGAIDSSRGLYDTGVAAFAGKTPPVAAGTTFQEVWTTFTVLAQPILLSVFWALGRNRQAGGDSFGTGGTSNFGSIVTVRLEYSIDSGSNWLILAEYIRLTQGKPNRITSVLLPGGATAALQVRATYTFHSGTSNPLMNVYDIVAQSGKTPVFDTTTGLFYAFSEWDGTNLIESTVSADSGLITMLQQNKVDIVLPGTMFQANAGTTNYRIYRTFDGGTVPKDLTMIAEVPVAATAFTDFFGAFNKDQSSPDLYPLISVTELGATVFVARDSPPASFSHIGFFKGSLVGISRTQPRVLAYSYAGRPDSWPSINVIDTLPLLEHDILVAVASAGDTLIIACANNMLAIDDLPRTVQGVFSSVDARPLRGQPGCVSQDAMVSFSVQGEPRVAWASKYGLHQTNGTNSSRISDAIDWNGTVGLGSLGAGTTGATTIVLFWDPSIQCLVLAYDSDGNGQNDRWFLIHMAPEHQNDDGQPRWTGPHYGMIGCLAGGVVSNVYRRYSGKSNGLVVYVENNGNIDDSQSFSGTQVPMIVKTSRMYGPGHEWGVFKANLYHTAFGAAQTMSVIWTTGRDQNATTQSVTKTPSLVSQQGNEFFVGLQGEWHEIFMQHTGTGTGAVLWLDMTTLGGSEPGTVVP